MKTEAYGDEIDVSVIIPTYNCELVIETTLRSVFEQKGCSYECIVVDAVSTDTTLIIAQRYQKKYLHCMQVLSEKDKGIYDAMNKGVEIARGKYVIFMGAGDSFCNENSLMHIKGRHADIVYGYVKAFDDCNQYVLKRKMNFLSSFRYRPICHQAVFAKKELLKKYPFELQYKYVADQAWILRMYSQGKKFQYIDEMIANYGMNGFSSTEQGRNEAIHEIIDARNRYLPIRSFLIRNIKSMMNIKLGKRRRDEKNRRKK